MRLDCEVTKIHNGGDTITIGLSGRQPSDAEWRRNVHQEIEVTCSDQVKRAFWLGRKAIITIKLR